jgi:multidrug efflux pump subunit AcrA (membrane-fusion protein)
VELQDLVIGIEAEGRVKGNDQMNLSFSLQEKLTEVLVQPGDVVKK